MTQNTAQHPFTPPKRRFKVIHTKQRYRSAGEDGPRLSPAEEIIEREMIQFGDSFVVFGNGGEYQQKTDVLAIAWEPGMRVEEITDDGA